MCIEWLVLGCGGVYVHQDTPSRLSVSWVYGVYVRVFVFVGCVPLMVSHGRHDVDHREKGGSKEHQQVFTEILSIFICYVAVI